MIWAKKREKRGCGSGASAVMTSNGDPSAPRTCSRLVTRQNSTISAIAPRAAAACSGEASPVSTKLKQRLGEERVVIGRAVADLHRLPHRLGDAAPGRIDQLARRRARDEDPRQVEQQRRVLVAARIQPGQRHRHFAAAQIGIADQVEGGIGRDEAVVGERAQQMRAAGPDHRLDLGERRARAQARSAGAAWDADSSMVSSSAATGAPIAAQSGEASSRALVKRRAQEPSRGLVAQFRKPGPAQQRPQRRIAERGPVEFRQMRVAAIGLPAAAGDRRRRTATGRPSRRQCAVGGPGNLLKTHEISFRAGVRRVAPESSARSVARPPPASQATSSA